MPHADISHCELPQLDAGFRIVELDADPAGRWADFVRSRPEALVYQHPEWVRVLAEAYGFRPLGLGCEDANRTLLGVLPLCYTRGVLSGRKLVSLPRTPLGGPLAVSEDVLRVLLMAAVQRVRAEKGIRLEIKVSQGGRPEAVPEMARVPWSTTYVRELPSDGGELRFGNTRNHAQIKRAVGKSRRLGVSVRPADNEADLSRWYQLYLRTLRRHGVPPRSYKFFGAAWKYLRSNGMMQLLLAEEGSPARLLAGSVFLSYGRTIFYAFTGSRDDVSRFRPNDAIHWQAMHDARESGFRYYDLGEVDANDEGLARFKAKWGAEPRWLYRYFHPAHDAPAHPWRGGDGLAARLARTAWRRVPTRATATIGDWLYRYL